MHTLIAIKVDTSMQIAKVVIIDPKKDYFYGLGRRFTLNEFFLGTFIVAADRTSKARLL